MAENLFKKSFEVQWRDVDPNMHMRHTVLGELTDQTRTSFFASRGLSWVQLYELGFGPVLLQYSARFSREIFLNEQISIDFRALGLSKDYRKFRLHHRVCKSDGTLCAEVEVVGGWMDQKKRKLAPPPEMIREILESISRDAAFEWMP